MSVKYYKISVIKNNERKILQNHRNKNNERKIIQILH
jgi:hypothetical protein